VIIHRENLVRQLGYNKISNKRCKILNKQKGGAGQLKKIIKRKRLILVGVNVE
tara:strand:+ start:1099 stop:1257 length:159 start_codon:yes stop_codon:yes gene_type:complete